jgi:hypothetical protein
MMRLPALTPDERAWLQPISPSGALTALAERVRCHLMVSLGGSVAVSEFPGAVAQGPLRGVEPLIRIAPELAAVWLAVRLGGKPEKAGMQTGDGALIEPFRGLIRRALAEAVINYGDTAWPQAMRMRVAIGSVQGNVEISWNSVHAVSWARQAIREKP